ncbi:hypothetical protein KIL84_020879 [Mauremys mutica]|uniref:Uncharacterized protein n=1 Tax=Mauremys mutica TaxID=74926 RepID=A0A9D4B102_9SAUR|nr:hypothetical protein KIL84_020879 [Mauremys mutica]
MCNVPKWLDREKTVMGGTFHLAPLETIVGLEEGLSHQRGPSKVNFRLLANSLLSWHVPCCEQLPSPAGSVSPLLCAAQDFPGSGIEAIWLVGLYSRLGFVQ